MAVTSVGQSRYRELALHLDDVRETGNMQGEGFYSEVVEVVFHGTVCTAKWSHVVWDLQLGGKSEEFMRVCKIWSRRQHPNVVQLLGLLPQPYSGSATNLPTIVMKKINCCFHHFVEAQRNSYLITFSVRMAYIYSYRVCEGRHMHYCFQFLCHNATCRLAGMLQMHVYVVILGFVMHMKMELLLKLLL